MQMENKLTDRLLKTQAIITIMTACIILWWQEDSSVAIAAFYGGSIAIINTLLQKWHLINSVKQVEASMVLRKVYLCAIQRWIASIIMFAIGFIVLKLPSVALLLGFIIVQLALLLAGLTANLKQRYG